MNIKSTLFCSALVAAFASQATADEVLLKNGSKLIGTVTKVHKNSLEVQTEFAGKLTIDLTKVKSFNTDKELHVEFGEAKEKLQGSVNFNGKKATITRKDGQKIKGFQPLTIWQNGEKHPEWVKPTTWEHKIFLNLNKKNGNTDSETLAGGFASLWKDDKQMLSFHGSFKRAESEQRKTDDELKLGADYEQVFGESKRHSWYLRQNWEKDDIEGIDVRLTSGLGYGYYFIKNDKTILRGRTGAVYRYEDYSQQDKESSEKMAVDFGFNLKHKLGWANWYTDITYTPAFEDLNDYRLNHESGIDIPFNIQENMKLSLKTGVNHQYNSAALADRNNLDTTYFMRLQLAF